MKSGGRSLAKQVRGHAVPLRVALLMESSLSVSRSMLRGIARYARERGPWILEYVSGGFSEQRLPERWHGDGIIARIPSESEARRILATRAPTVVLDPHRPFASPEHPVSRLPRVVCDNEAVGRAAATHFLERGFTEFAWIGASASSTAAINGSSREEPNWAAGRRKGYEDALAERGFAVRAYAQPRSRRVSENWSLEAPAVARWLESLPKPVAIFAPHDARARQVADACLASGIAVPYSAAILGVNDDPALCASCLPPLSSVPLDAERAGYEAAKMLDSLMRGLDAPSIIKYGPMPVASRDSTLPLQNSDPLVTSVLERIRKARGFDMNVGELAREIGVTARTLEAHFRAAVGRSVGDVKRSLCLAGVRDLVETTDRPFADIARESGHLSAAHLAAEFRRRYGLTMTEARRAASAARR